MRFGLSISASTATRSAHGASPSLTGVRANVASANRKNPSLAPCAQHGGSKIRVSFLLRATTSALPGDF
jgi:hypothetical protein